MGGCTNHMTDTHKGKNAELSPFHKAGKEGGHDPASTKNYTPPAKEYPKR